MTAALEVRRSDVLVVGGGLAALQAAIAAREAGAHVTMVCKRRVGKSGCSAMTSAGIAAVIPGLVREDSPGQHMADTLTGGGDIADAELVRVLCEEAPRRVLEADRRGARFGKTGGVFDLHPSGEHRHLRSVVAENFRGTDYTLPLTDLAAAIGVEMRDNTLVVDLLLDDAGEVRGAVLVDRAGVVGLHLGYATILATGGAGELYPLSSNPKEVTGDGFSLALRAGAELRDMEFVQFYPWRCIAPFTQSRMPVQPGTFVVGGRLFNSAGERFMSAYDPVRVDATTRDLAARGIYEQVRNGKGFRGGARLDLSEVSPADWEATNPKIVKSLERYTDDYRTYPFVVGPEAHYWMGGVSIASDCATTVPRLYAAGEVTGGIQGANRLSNNAISEGLVFGARAGRAAAVADRKEAAPEQFVPLARDWQRAVDAMGTRPRAGADELRRRVQAIADRSIGIIRRDDLMAQGQHDVADLQEDLGRAGVSSLPDLTSVLGTVALTRVAEMALAAGRLRTESRGAHFREDFPARDDNAWKRSIVIRREPALGPASFFESTKSSDAVPAAL